MGRPLYKYDHTNCTGGINGQDDEKLSQHQCKDALNVWAPNGIVEKRLGFVGLTNVNRGYSVSTDSPILIKEDNSVSPPTYTAYDAGFVLTLSGLRALAVGVPRDRWLFGYKTDAAFEALCDIYSGMDLEVVDVNGNNTHFVAEYYDEDATWRPLNVVEWASVSGTSTHLADIAPMFSFVPPKDWTESTITAGGVNYTAKWIRLGMANANLDALVTVKPAFLDGHDKTETLNAFSIASFSDGPRYINLTTYLNSGTPAIFIGVWSSLDRANANLSEGGEIPGALYSKDLAVLATVPDYDEAYLSLGYASARIARGVEAISPVIESDAVLLTEYTGLNLLPAWPKAKYTQYFRGELWVANLEDSPYQVRWSAPQPCYKVWPELNTEFLVENDKSPITGLYGFGQNMVVFKNDSIYEMVDTGISSQKLQTYAPERRVAGKGAVSHHTIQNINGRLVFLAEDGVYAYDGSQTVQNLGLDRETNVDRIKHIVKRISPGARNRSVGINWSTKHCYLLAVPLDGANDNTHVLCYDYENDAWWLWEIQVCVWTLDEGPDDNQILYFVDKNGMVYRFDRGTTDHGAVIKAYVVTRQMVASNATFRAREVEVKSTNLSRELDVSIGADDEPLEQVTAATLSYTDEVEKDYNTAIYDVDNYTIERDRKRAVGVKLDGNSFRVKVEHTDKFSPFKLSKISVGYIPVGKR